MRQNRMWSGANAPLVLALLCAVPARAFVVPAPLSARMPLARQGSSWSLVTRRAVGPPGVHRRQDAQLSMHMDYQGLVNAAALVGAALPDTPLTTNLGVRATASRGMLRGVWNQPQGRVAMEGGQRVEWLGNTLACASACTRGHHNPSLIRLFLAAGPLTRTHVDKGPMTSSHKHLFHKHDCVRPLTTAARYHTSPQVPSPVLVHQVLFLASNLSYLIAGAAILRRRASPKTVMGVGLWAIGLASTLFHYFQCIMPVGSPVTTAFCALDSIIACSLFPLFGITCWKALIRPTPRFLIVWSLAFACYLYVGPYYTLTHALWHLTTAYGAYSLVEDRDDFEASGRPAPQLAFWSGALAAARERGDNAVYDLKQRAKKALASGARS